MYTELNKKTAYRKGKPKMANVGWSREYTLGVYLIERVLLDLGGVRVEFPFYEYHYVEIQTRGQHWKSDRVRYLAGNSDLPYLKLVSLWERNKNTLFLMKGYALAQGVWREHMWLIDTKEKENWLVEAGVPYEQYFGFALTEEESEQFCNQLRLQHNHIRRQ